MARYIVKLLNYDKNVNNRIQYLADDIDKQREETINKKKEEK